MGDTTVSPVLPTEFQRLIDHVCPKRRERAQRDLEALTQMGIASFEELIARLPTLSVDERWTPLAALVHFGKGRAVPPLLRILRDPGVQARWQLLRPFSHLRGERVFRTLTKLVRNDPDPEVREQAAHQLAWLFDERVYEPLLDVLQNREEMPRVRAQAAEGLGMLLDCADARNRRFRQAASSLITALQDPAPEVRFWSAYALGVMRARAALPELQHLAATDDAMCAGWWLVREEASDAAAYILGGPWPERRPASWLAVQDGTR